MSRDLNRIQLKKTVNGSVFNIVVNGKIRKEDYDEWVPQMEWQIAKDGRIHLLIELVDFRGLTLGALWEDTKFGVRHFADIDRMAVIGAGKRWERGITAMIKPFTRAKVRYFDTREKNIAESWIEMG